MRTLSFRRYHRVGFDGAAERAQALLQGLCFVIASRGVSIVDLAGEARGDVDGGRDAALAAVA